MAKILQPPSGRTWLLKLMLAAGLGLPLGEIYWMVGDGIPLLDLPRPGPGRNHGGRHLGAIVVVPRDRAIGIDRNRAATDTCWVKVVMDRYVDEDGNEGKLPGPSSQGAKRRKPRQWVRRG